MTSIFDLYQIPDNTLYRYRICSMIQHLDPTTTTKSKRFFGKTLRKAMADEAAFFKMRELKEKEELKKKQAETPEIEAGQVAN